MILLNEKERKFVKEIPSIELLSKYLGRSKKDINDTRIDIIVTSLKENNIFKLKRSFLPFNEALIKYGPLLKETTIKLNYIGNSIFLPNQFLNTKFSRDELDLVVKMSNKEAAKFLGRSEVSIISKRGKTNFRPLIPIETQIKFKKENSSYKLSLKGIEFEFSVCPDVIKIDGNKLNLK